MQIDENKLQKFKKGHGESRSMNFKDNLSFIEKIEKIEWIRGLADDRVGNPELQEFVNLIYAKLRKHRLGLYIAGIDIGYQRTQWLGAIGAINANLANNVSKKHLNIVQTRYIEKFRLNYKGEIEGELKDRFEVDGVYEDTSEGFNQGDLIAAELSWDVGEDYSIISRDAWKIDDIFNLPDEIYDMIVTINRGWQFFQTSDHTKWKRFNKYRAQAYRWIDDNYHMEDSWSMERKIQFLQEERRRCLTNSLYLANKYLWYKDPDDELKGESKFKAWTAQEVVLFLIDLGLSLIVGKLRQIGFTTVIGGVMALRTMISRNVYIKLVAQKGDKSEEIFEEKVKYPITRVDEVIKPTVANWSGEKVKFGHSSGKGRAESTASVFEVCAPAADAINAGKPRVTLLDEIGFNKFFGEIIAQGRPTMFKFDTKTGKMRMNTQVIAWGTGGKTGGSGAPMEVEWKAAKQAFAERNFRHGLVPLFINFYAKPGHTDEFYMQEKSFYYSKKKKAGEEDPKIVFHQSFPITEDDMFLQSSDTVISIAAINLHIDRIQNAKAKDKLKSVVGYFEPLFNMEKKRGEDSYIPYEIIGARFVPADQTLIDENSPFACVELFEQPDLNWTNLYYKGTDPIFTSSGHSKFASVIWNSKKKRVAARFNFKSEDYRYEYLQSLLLNLYYSRSYGGRKTGIKELLEFNVGGEYYNFCRELGYGGMFTGNKMLPQTLQTSTIDIGINKRGTNTLVLVNRLEEMLMEHANNMDSLEFWVQMKTFVKKETGTGYTYGPENKKIHYDDEIDATVYAKINADAHEHLTCKYVEESEVAASNGKKLRYYYDSSFNLCLGTAAAANRVRR